jgi:uncharacterized protein (TIGR03032 family)
MNLEAQPFACTHSANLPAILHSLHCTIAISTYQAGKVILLSAVDPHKLIQLPRSFSKPMGIAIDHNRLALATQNEVVIFNNAHRMASNYPNQPNTYDALFLPRSTYFTGEIDVHDLHWTTDRLWAVNTRFSCLAFIDHNHSFSPQWKPYFINQLKPDDQCHLNGVAFEGDVPKYITALGQTNTSGGWRANKANGGIVMDVQQNNIIAEGLGMPHSPRLFDGQLYILESASGNLSKIDPSNGEKEVIISLDGFVRGMDKIGDYLFIGLSKLREKSKSFSDLPIARKSVFCGLVVLHLPTAKIIGHLKYENSVEEIYDVRIFPGMRRPNLLSHQKKEHHMALTTPETDYWAIVNDQPSHD